MESFPASFLMIFAAEIGDKTQLAATAFAARFKVRTVVSAVLSAVILNNFIAVAAGSFLSGVFSLYAVKTVSGIVFILFGLWVLCARRADGAESGKQVFINPFITVALFFCLSEFGDKTQIFAAALTMNYGAPVYVFFGACAGMILANLIGMGIGIVLGKSFPAGTVKSVSALIFIIFGLIIFWDLFAGYFGFTNALAAEIALAVFAAAAVFVILKLNKSKERK